MKSARQTKIFISYMKFASRISGENPLHLSNPSKSDRIPCQG